MSLAGRLLKPSLASTCSTNRGVIMLHDLQASIVGVIHLQGAGRQGAGQHDGDVLRTASLTRQPTGTGRTRARARTTHTTKRAVPTRARPADRPIHNPMTPRPTPKQST